ncbi:Predicted arabinose efflux permease, MFS family [Microlunatus sagamiharensis]|uniref:Predicted arabinose efflux permease, MFS family n=1 Tax=Microlunatus sagamiharensis TaxID=546874 RepID=A0A1H2LVV4_9ACTN|nr:MFS transporter [Microlunatus sagamiharensis]SDU84982.1 Predicted arabinose efflux permease, MFS family [Microlunatus sagamiharensis]
MRTPVAPQPAAEVRLGTGLKAYGRLLRHGPAAGPFLFATLARLTLSMIPLGILILVEAERHTYALAGLVSGAYAVGAALGTPLWGRLMDRLGQLRVLLPTSLASAGLLVALTLATTRGAGEHVLMLLAAGVGLAYPAIGPALRSSFRIALPDAGSRRVAFALDGVSVELTFVLGPLFLSSLLLPGIGPLPLLVTAGLLVAGGVGYCLTGVARRADARTQRLAAGHDPDTDQAGPRTALTAAGVPAVLLVMLVLSIGFGQLDTSMAATADLALGSTDRVGILFAAIAGGSTIGGLAYGARHWGVSERRAVPALLALFGVLLTTLALLLSSGVTTLVVLLPVLFLTGLTIAPTLIMQQALLDQLVPPGRLNEAQAFLSASNTTGAALGTAVAGVVIDAAGPAWSYGGAAIGMLAAAVVALVGHRRR